MAYGDTGLTNLVLEGDLTVGDDAVVTGDLEVIGAVVSLANLPTADPGVAGQLWSNSNVLTVSAGA